MRDARKEGFGTGGYRKGGIQDCRNLGLEGFRTGPSEQDVRDARKEGFRTGGIQERRDSGLE